MDLGGRLRRVRTELRSFSTAEVPADVEDFPGPNTDDTAGGIVPHLGDTPASSISSESAPSFYSADSEPGAQDGVPP